MLDHTIPCQTCAGRGRVEIHFRSHQAVATPEPEVITTGAQPIAPHLVQALDFILDMALQDHVRGITSMVTYRLGAVSGVRACGPYWNSLDCAGLCDTATDLIQAWHDATIAAQQQDREAAWAARN
jgi:hypothetical protein